MSSAKLRQVAWVWGLSLALAAALTAAGARWPEPLPPRADAALALVLLPPLGMLLWLIARGRQGDGRGGESLRTRESARAEQETR